MSQKRKGQKHQNKTAWEVKFDPKYDQQKRKVKLNLLCKRCMEQILWKLQFGKYKKQSQPSRCNYCELKVVVKTYHKACDFCAKQKDVCSKCLKSNKDLVLPDEIPQLDDKKKKVLQIEEQKKMNQYLKKLRERSKRTVLRNYNKGTYLWNQEQQLFTDQQGQPIQGLKFREAQNESDFEDVDEQDEYNQDDEDFDDDDF